MISQGIEAKLDGQERNNSISRLKFLNGSVYVETHTRAIVALLSEYKTVSRMGVGGG